jgi:hypothetical protein
VATSRCPATDPSSQALPDSQFVVLSVPIMLNQPPNPKLIIGSRRTGSIGELAVPGDHQIPAVPRSRTPSTMPDDPYLTYNQPGRQKKPTNESFPTPPSPPRATKNSSYTTIPTTQAAAAATPQASRPVIEAAMGNAAQPRVKMHVIWLKHF